LFESINQGVADIRDQVNSLIIPGPVGYFQMRLFATFGPELNAFHPKVFEEAHKERSAKGIGLAMLQYRENRSIQTLFSEAFNVFLHCNVFTPSLAPFSMRACGPAWFTREFPTKDDEYEEETNVIWKAYLTPMLLSSKATPNTSTGSYGAYGYQPNLVARQFGLVQIRPCSFYQSKEDKKKPKIETQWRALLLKFNGNLPNFNPFRFELSYECTKSFFKWWRR